MTTVDRTAETVPPEPTALPDDLHARHLLLLASGGRLARIVHVVAELGIADQLADRPRTVAELAAATGAHELSLYRILRGAAAVGIFVEGRGKTFANTPLSDGLRSDNTDGVLPLVKYNNMDITWRPFDEIMHSVRTGEPSFDRVFGHSFYQHLERNAEVGAFFERFMMHWSRQLVLDELPDVGLERFARIADLGGGDGWFLAQVLRRNPHTTGVLLDLPRVVSAARPVLDEEGVADRVTVVPGDFFTHPLPTGCDAYLLKAVLHNWSDDRAAELLRRVRATIGDTGATLLVFDQVMAPRNRWDHAKFLDVDMLVLFGGRERTLDEWHELFDSTGFELISEPVYHWTMLECRPK
ncbi:methyltransferase [Amycolatopsis anabasis]|uniref:methyltransferase n=1 Tax=Amycolatopsis anabasis TaxID=1840409 RepID=UPI00131DB2F2|nr:methyltransferase [Amycolatopsis anabasis]